MIVVDTEIGHRYTRSAAGELDRIVKHVGNDHLIGIVGDVCQDVVIESRAERVETRVDVFVHVLFDCRLLHDVLIVCVREIEAGRHGAHVLAVDLNVGDQLAFAVVGNGDLHSMRGIVAHDARAFRDRILRGRVLPGTGLRIGHATEIDAAIGCVGRILCEVLDETVYRVIGVGSYLECELPFGERAAFRQHRLRARETDRYRRGVIVVDKRDTLRIFVIFLHGLGS